MRARARSLRSLAAKAAVLVVAACGPSLPADPDAVGIDAVPPDAACINLQCQQVRCDNGATTRLSGTVFTPRGALPLPNVIVYVPNAPLQPISEGVSCDRCDDQLSGQPLVRTTTDVQGRFALDNVPVGPNIPLVMQIGKWRRVVEIPTVAACVDNPVTNPELTRLPRNQSEGHIPRMALTTGGWDALECLLRKVGIDDVEFTHETGAGRVNFYNGRGGTSRFASGTTFTDAPTFWDSLTNLRRYDVVLHSCEGLNDANNKSAEARQALADYTAAGGRVFMSHYHNWWMRAGPEPWPRIATTWQNGSPSSPLAVTIDTSFDRGQQLADWLLFTGASTVLGQISVVDPRATVPELTPGLAQRWAYSASSVQYLAFNTPLVDGLGNEVPERDRCGRMVFSDLHVSGGSGRDTPGTAFPNGCTTTDLLPQEKALIFMLFDITGCIAPDIP
jgi:hypothetical protein